MVLTAAWFALVAVACVCCAFHLASEAAHRFRNRKLVDSPRIPSHPKYGSRA